MLVSAIPTSSRDGGHRGLDRAAAAAGLSRGELFAGLCILGFANGVMSRVQGAILQDGATMAIAGTFNTSVVVWIAFVACPLMLLRGPREAFLRADLFLAAGVLAAIMLPVAHLSWLGLTALALYMLADPFGPPGMRPESPMRRGAWILLATTGAMFWGRVLLFSASGPVLDTDARMVGWLTGMETIGNTVRFAGGDGHVWIAPFCSSLSNISLAILCWVLFAQHRGVAWSPASVGWCLLACLSVVAVNVTRISLMVLHPAQFDFIHGPVGSAVAGALSVVLMLGICMWGTRHARFAPA
ncbi:hypothetical protein [Dankookia sp. P2]|uniref:hypothetical protein n=1 Tax=Dankookia sp. P2 TaxID=3423955 RepID=UPI003D67F31E